MSQSPPTFPPLLNGHALRSGLEPFSHTCDRAKEGEFSAGDLVWSQETDRLTFALVLEPDVPRHRCGEMLYVAMVAFGDAAGALIPPEVAITYQWPNTLQMNDGKIGSAQLVLSDAEEGGVPDWMVIGLEVRLRANTADMNPGENYHETTFWEEGCGHISHTELLESVSRHTVNVIHTWTEDGFRPIHELWMGRLNNDAPLAPDLLDKNANFIGVDEEGKALLSINGETVSRDVADAIESGGGIMAGHNVVSGANS